MTEARAHAEDGFIQAIRLAAVRTDKSDWRAAAWALSHGFGYAEDKEPEPEEASDDMEDPSSDCDPR